MRIAVAANGKDLKAIIPDRYEESQYLVIVETDDFSIVDTFERQDEDGVFFAEKTVEYDCEAIVCGIMQMIGHDLVAENCVTRYNGSGCNVEDGARGALKNTLPYITDYEGGTGCGSQDGGECHLHD